MIKYSFNIIIFLLISACSFAQQYKLSELDTMKEYTSLKEALLNPDAVVRLSLKGQKLKQFPTEIFQFKNLQDLNLKRNRITEIPNNIDSLVYLQRIELTRNSLTEVPKEIGNLSYLKVIHLGQNEIEFLPKEMSQLQNLLYLDIWSNNIAALPPEFADLKNLQTLDMRVIQLNEQRQKDIEELLPHTKILFSASCNCD